MKTKLLLTLAGSLLVANSLVAQPADAAPAPDSAAPAPAAVEPVPAEALAAEAKLVAQAEAPKPAAEAPAPEAKPADPAPAPAASGEVLPLIMFEDAPLNDAIKTLARQAGINFQFDPRVATPPPGPDGKPAPQATVSIRFENITALQALEAVLGNHGLQLVDDPKTKTARITIKDPAAPAPLITKVIQLKYSAADKITPIIKPSVGARGTVAFDSRTSQVIVIATEAEHNEVQKLIDTLDIPTRQVLIESHIVETARNPQSVKGINWAGTLAAQNVSWGNNATAGVLADPSVSPRVIADTVNGASGVALNPLTAFLNADGVSAVISFFNTDNESEVVATPRAVTLDNEKAMLSVTRAFPIFQVTPGSANSPAGAQIQYTNLGTILEVTPRIAADDTINLKVVPEVSNVDGQDRQTVGGLENIANIYAIRRIEANVVVPSGNTLVMGGLVSDSVNKGYTKVPILGDTPGLGALFRTKDNKKSKSNLIIFVTPTIVKDHDYHVASSGRDYLKTGIPAAPSDVVNWFDSGKPARAETSGKKK
jgi:general secretion pathway protein D